MTIRGGSLPRGRLRLKNARLVSAREELGMSQKAFAQFIGVGYLTYNAYENMRLYPGDGHRKLLAAFCLCSEEELFPIEFKEFAECRDAGVVTSTAAIWAPQFLGLSCREAKLVASSDIPEPEADFDESRVNELICVALETLSDDHAKILRLYYGLDGEEPMTLKEIGLVIGVAKDIVRQRKDKALSCLRRREYRWLQYLHDNG